MSEVFESLSKIVGEDHVSEEDEELYYHARDLSVLPPKSPDYVVTPKTTEEVQKVVKLANRENIPIIPMGAGMSITGLTVPQEGGIVVDMKRMNEILEVNENSKVAIVEGGTPQGKLLGYLEENHPDLWHSLPNAPFQASIAANAAIHGQGRLSQQHGFNSDMVSGLEVVLPTGEVCKIGSCSMSPYWFSKGPALPDLSGLFLGWLGTTGIITKIGMKLYPRKEKRDLEIFVTDREELIPDIIYNLTQTEMIEDINLLFQPKPLLFKGNHHVALYITGDTDEELDFKKKIIERSVKEFMDSSDAGFMRVFPQMKESFLEIPQLNTTRFADLDKGGGFQYSGPIVPVKKYPEFVNKTHELSKKYDLKYGGTARIIDGGHAMMFSSAFTFDRSDSEMMEKVRKAGYEMMKFAFDEGAIPWKPTRDEQEMAMDMMDSNTLNLMGRIKKELDPNGIMNPGNWEIDQDGS